MRFQERKFITNNGAFVRNYSVGSSRSSKSKRKYRSSSRSSKSSRSSINSKRRGENQRKVVKYNLFLIIFYFLNNNLAKSKEKIYKKCIASCTKYKP